jgi:hypothetical protein
MVHLGLFFDILDSYIFFTKQKQIIQDKDDAIQQIIEAVEGKLSSEVEGEENKSAQAEYRIKWEKISGKYK